VEVSDEMQLLLRKAMIRRGIPIEKLPAVTESNQLTIKNLNK
jgi:hypothetical protein